MTDIYTWRISAIPAEITPGIFTDCEILKLPDLHSLTHGQITPEFLMSGTTLFDLALQAQSESDSDYTNCKYIQIRKTHHMWCWIHMCL